MRTFAAVVIVAVAALALAACDNQRAAKLEEGVSSEGDVRAQFGEPAAVYDHGGSRTLEYPRQPEGQTNLMVTIGPDGRMSALRQVLKATEFAKVTPGLDKSQVRRLLGKPAKTQRYDVKNEEQWDWRWLDGQSAKVFSVTFDPDGKVIVTAVADDPRATQVGG